MQTIIHYRKAPEVRNWDAIISEAVGAIVISLLLASSVMGVLIRQLIFNWR